MATISWIYHLESFEVATMTWLTVMEYQCHKWSWIRSIFRKHFPVPSSFMTYHRVCNWSTATDVTSGAGTGPLPEHLSSSPVFYWGAFYSIFSILCSVLKIIACLLSFFRFAILLSGLLQFTVLASVYPFVIFKHVLFHNILGDLGTVYVVDFWS